MAADFLSRAPKDAPEAEPSAVDRSINTIVEASVNQLPVTYEQVERATRNDHTLTRVAGWLVNGWPQGTQNVDPEAHRFTAAKEGLHLSKEILMYGPRVVIPSSLRTKVLEELHQCHQGMVRTKAVARQHIYWPGISEDMENQVRHCEVCQAWGPSTQEALIHPTGWPKETCRPHVIDSDGSNVKVVGGKHFAKNGLGSNHHGVTQDVCHIRAASNLTGRQCDLLSIRRDARFL
jgi:hypothetical protein